MIPQTFGSHGPVFFFWLFRDIHTVIKFLILSIFVPLRKPTRAHCLGPSGHLVNISWVQSSYSCEDRIFAGDLCLILLLCIRAHIGDVNFVKYWLALIKELSLYMGIVRVTQQMWKLWKDCNWKAINIVCWRFYAAMINLWILLNLGNSKMYSSLIQRKLSYRLCLDSWLTFVTDQRRKWVSKNDLVKIDTFSRSIKGLHLLWFLPAVEARSEGYLSEFYSV